VLVLSRKTNESVVISVPGYEPITITVVAVAGDKAKLGFAADRSINIHRQEVARAIDRDGVRKKVDSQ